MSLRTAIRQALDPTELWRAVYHTTPDDWQAELLRSDHPRIILNTSRQVGKSTVVSCKALHTALYRPRSLVLLLSPSLRQSSELGKKLFDGYRELGRPIRADSESKLVLELTNGSRVICLPGADPNSIRGFSSVNCLLLDESARCSEELWLASKPMVSVSGGSIILLSTPFGRRGFFYQTWAEGDDWLKIQVTAEQCPRLSPTFLRQERRELGERWFNQEYMCQFVEAVGQLFSDEAIDAAFRDDITPLFPVTTAVEEDAILTDQSPLFLEDS
jgi:phage terminase large subunit-like protein